MSAHLGKLLVSRLALRIYVVGLMEVALVAAGFFAIVSLTRPPPPVPAREQARSAAKRLAAHADQLDALKADLQTLHAASGAELALIGRGGEVIASTEGAEALRCPDVPPLPPPPPPLEDEGPHRRRHPPLPPPDPIGPPPGAPFAFGVLCATAPLEIEGRPARLHFLAPPPAQPPSVAPLVIPLVLLVVGAMSLVLAWSLVRPLGKLSATAKALGSGDLDARAHLNRKDELGDVARAFDEMADRLRTLLRAEKELLANVSHELRTPLSRIRVALDLAAEGDGATAREALADISGDLDELERLLSDVLMAARLDLAASSPRAAKEGAAPGLPPLRREVFEAADLLREATDRFRIAHPGRPLHHEAPAALPRIEGDKILLRRALENLLTNADKYTESPDEPITLRAKEEGGALVIEVIDRGIGIDDEDMQRVFRPFFRADKSRTRSTGGLGLGLALAKRIVDAHGGSLVLESKPEEGTIARLCLPV